MFDRIQRFQMFRPFQVLVFAFSLVRFCFDDDIGVRDDRICALDT